jgi:mannose-6-phosphate isomerase-like protein (cupin superfamily)
MGAEQLWFMNTLVTPLVSSAEGADGISVLANLASQGDSPPLHVHHSEDEVFLVQEGMLRVRVGDEDLALGEGESAVAPMGVPHTYRVESDRARWLVVTAQGDFERFVRSVSRPAERDDLPEPAPPPTPEQAEAFAAVCRDHGIELVGPPLG